MYDECQMPIAIVLKIVDKVNDVDWVVDNKNVTLCVQCIFKLVLDVLY